MEFKEGDAVLYESKETHIESLTEDGSAVIANPSWDWDTEGECVDLDIDYDIPFWITVPIGELKPLKP